MSYKPKTGIYETDSTINTSRTVSGTGDLIIDLPGITEFGDISGVGSGLSLSFNNAADSWSLGDNASGSSGWLISSSVGSFQIGDSSGSNGNMLIEFMHSTGVTNYISIGESNTVQLHVDAQNSTVTMGDHVGSGNSTTVYVDDINSTTTISNLVTFDSYGTGVNTGTATYALAVDSSGNIIEESLVGNLGNHIMTQNLETSDNWISNDGDNEGIFIHSNGKVGIGTDSPNNNLEIYDSVAAGDVSFSVDNDADDGRAWFRIMARDGVGGVGPNLGCVAYGDTHATNPSDVTLGAYSSDVFNIFTNNASPINLQTNNVTRIAIAGNGKVGIGTSNPSRDLHIHKSTPASSSTIQITRNESGFTNSDGVVFGLSTTGDAQFWLFENNDFYIATNSQERMRVTSDGKVGIGTDSPNNNLEIYDSVAAGDVSFSVDNDADDGRAWFRIMARDGVGGVGPNLGCVAYGDTHATNPSDVTLGAYSSDVFNIFTNNASPINLQTNNVTRIAIAADGKVGIGTTNPGALLEVSDESYPVVRVVRTTSSPSNVLATFQCVASSSVNVVDGFGTVFDFAIADDTATTPVPIASIGAVRDGADDTGKLRFSVQNAGVKEYKLDISSAGVFTFNSTGSAPVDVSTSGTATFNIGNYPFNSDQTVGAAQDGYVLTYNDGTGEIELQAGGGGSNTVSTETTSPVTVPTTSNLNLFYFVDASSGNVAVNLPASSGFGAAEICVKKIDSSSNTVTINRAGSDSIDGSATLVIGSQYDSARLVSDGGTNWFIV